MEKQQHFNLDLVINLERHCILIGFLIKILIKEKIILYQYGPIKCFFDCEIFNNPLKFSEFTSLNGPS